MGKAIRINYLIIILLAIVTALFFGYESFSRAFAESQTLTLYCFGGEIENGLPNEDGTFDFALSEGENLLPIPQKQGYEFLGWTKSDKAEDKDYITSLVLSDENIPSELYAKYRLETPLITCEPLDYSGVYGNEPYVLSFEVSPEIDGELSFQWYKDGVLIENATQNTLTVKNVKDSGIYQVETKFSVENESVVFTSRKAIVRIQKARITTAPPILLEGVYSPEKTLADYTLQENFVWLDCGIIPTPSVRKYSAIFNIDKDNYFDYPCQVTLILSKAEQKIYAENYSKEYDGLPISISATTSGNSDLIYSDNNVLSNVGRELVTITAPETDLYLESSISVVLEITPQILEINWFNLQFVYNQKECIPSAIALDKEGFDVDLRVYGGGVDAGTYRATAQTISKNYLISNPTVEYTIAKADYNAELLVFEDKEFVFDGLPHTLEITNLPDWISVSYDKTPTDVGIYTITASFTVSNSNYNEINPKTASLTILRNHFEGEWFEIFCPEGAHPDIELRLELIDNLDGLYRNHHGKLKYILGFSVVSSDGSVYKKPMTICFNYEKVGIDNLVLSVDKNSNEQILTYAYENGQVKVSVSGGENNIVFAERSKGIAWIILLVIGVCVAVSVGLYLFLTKKSKPQDEETKNELTR